MYYSRDSTSSSNCFHHLTSRSFSYLSLVRFFEIGRSRITILVISQEIHRKFLAKRDRDFSGIVGVYHQGVKISGAKFEQNPTFRMLEPQNKITPPASQSGGANLNLARKTLNQLRASLDIQSSAPIEPNVFRTNSWR